MGHSSHSGADGGADRQFKLVATVCSGGETLTCV